MSDVWRELDEALAENDLRRARDLLAEARTLIEHDPHESSVRFEHLRDDLPIKKRIFLPWTPAIAAMVAAGVLFGIAKVGERGRSSAVDLHDDARAQPRIARESRSPMDSVAQAASKSDNTRAPLRPQASHSAMRKVEKTISKGDETCGPARLRLARWIAEGEHGYAAPLAALEVSPSTALVARVELASRCWVEVIAWERYTGRATVLVPLSERGAGESDLYGPRGEGAFRLEGRGKFILLLAASPLPIRVSAEQIVERAMNPGRSVDTIIGDSIRVNVR